MNQPGFGLDWLASLNLSPSGDVSPKTPTIVVLKGLL